MTTTVYDKHGLEIVTDGRSTNEHLTEQVEKCIKTVGEFPTIIIDKYDRSRIVLLYGEQWNRERFCEIVGRV